jgi:SAM-dependent methyltransferase
MQSPIGLSFSKAANSYDKYALCQYFAAEKLIHSITITPHHILDIGCGTGILTDLLKRKFPQAHFTLVDISPAMLKIAQEKLGRHSINYLCGDGQNIDFIKNILKTHNIDLCVSNLCFQWLNNPYACLQAYQSYVQTYVSVLLDKSFYQWYESVKIIRPNFKPPITLFPENITTTSYDYHCSYHSGLEFLRTQKYLGTLTSHDYPLSVTELKKACKIFETQHNASISYNIGIIIDYLNLNF